MWLEPKHCNKSPPPFFEGGCSLVECCWFHSRHFCTHTALNLPYLLPFERSCIFLIVRNDHFWNENPTGQQACCSRHKRFGFKAFGKLYLVITLLELVGVWIFVSQYFWSSYEKRDVSRRKTLIFGKTINILKTILTKIIKMWDKKTYTCHTSSLTKIITEWFLNTAQQKTSSHSLRITNTFWTTKRTEICN